MSKECQICKCKIPSSIFIDGKKKKINKTRKLCLKCQPFKYKALNKYCKNKVCLICSKKIPDKSHFINKCFLCTQKERTNETKKKIYNLVGTSCWICNYNKGLEGTAILDFHHLNREDKCFELSIRNLVNLKWESVLTEMKKCVLLCCRCHREVEYNFIDNSIVQKIFKEKWEDINKKYEEFLITEAEKELQPDKIESMLKDFSIIEISKKLNISYVKLIKFIKKNNIYYELKIKRKFNPTKEELELDINSMSMIQVGKKYGVRDNSVRKRCKKLGIKLPKFKKGHWIKNKNII